ncbi:mitochondrial coenzyme A diphosphatase NUDT8-like isoform X2 [Ostrea edulis]|uniref:mitochondrial coenzyme A diphosphatase NUDT8-like isoform X2 n=1 Tax=Ostrea edulis TaxID=37623 RepID=UPI00209576AD|nr:mitochondrial coenzyme A diphosphatase NUDT8-like isoform X2 [Ostrea edulis]XP_056013149.1 mitochondrial coenzyme A diphosphatase NUDT8-like isoform X2 [Ostrea edulis]XP_056013152.1 mitochondrial coenzyme A diphosphatase NUDT8-like isoform X2 [Ostrea edulis]XP_056013159.1 mitochondrial coenzyme A diphosphatase NUDT8-like isoform X2 [Ostrea edulis]
MRNIHAMKLTKLYSKNILLERHIIHSIRDRIICKQCKLFHSNSVVYDKSTVTFGNILSNENRVRIQNKLQKYEQPVIRKVAVSDNHKKAAVLVPLCTVNGEPSLLFMVRSNLIPAHRGEVSFPGGMMDNTDQDLITTALRETQEEIGLEIPREAVWGSLQSLPSRNGETLVTPIIASFGELQENQLRLNKDEVESIFTRKIVSLCDSKNVGSTQFRRGKLPSLQSGYTLPVYLGGGHRIWGLTAVILHMFLPVLAPGLYKFKLRHRH